MSHESAAIRDAIREIERIGGKFLRREELSRHTRVYYDMNGSEYYVLLSRTKAFPAPLLRRVIRRKFAYDHRGNTGKYREIHMIDS